MLFLLALICACGGSLNLAFDLNVRATNFLGHRDKPECESYNISRDIEKNPGPEFDIGPEYESYNISGGIEKKPRTRI